MKNTFIYYLFTGLVLMLFSSCSEEYSVDFNKIHFPGASKLDHYGVDSILKKQDADFVEEPEDSVKAETDRKTYHFGEEVILSITNKSSEMQYFYEANEDSESYFNAFPDMSDSKKSEYKKQLISDNPAIMGKLSYLDPCFINLRVEGINSVISSKLGLEGFDIPLKPGETMTFKVKMPKRAGHYRFLMTRHVAHGESALWNLGTSLYIISNTFEIVEK
ncbi:hypothetical protein [Fluviicola sp.]|uniref:hypothetical protein n=1 Tax=Fluviicola sp. TaxID=1917219 RepID=UPI003D2D6548